MIGAKQYLIRATPYLLSKLAGAGFFLFIIFIYGVLSIEIDMFEIVEDISKLFPLAIALSFFTILIDLFIYKLAIKSKAFKILLYIIAGFVFFIPTLIFVIFIWLAIWGSIMSLIIYLGSYLSLHSKKFRYIFSIVVPILFFILINIDFTVKKGWEEVISTTSYEATFDVFNGKFEIPIHLEKGKTLIFIRDDDTTRGGLGFHMLNEKDIKVGYKELNENVYQYTVNKSGVYRLVFSGDDAKGYFKVKWKIE